MYQVNFWIADVANRQMVFIIKSINMGIMKHEQWPGTGMLSAYKLLHCYLRERTILAEMLRLHISLTIIVLYRVISEFYL